MKSFFVAIFISISLSGNSQEIPVFWLHYYILTYQYIVEGTVTHIGPTNFIIKVHNWIKGSSIRKNKTHIKYTHLLLPKDYTRFEPGLELNRKYIFILGRKKGINHVKRIAIPELRFVVEKDSLFLPFNALKDISFDENINIKQKNTFNDPLISEGYKISKEEFIDLIEMINNTYHNYGNCILKKKEIDTNVTYFQLSVLNHLDESWWKKKSCKN